MKEGKGNENAEAFFFKKPQPVPAKEIAECSGAELISGDPELQIFSVAPLEEAGPGDLCFISNPKYVSFLKRLQGCACFAARRHLEKIPKGVTVLLSQDPYRSFAQAVSYLYPESLRPLPVTQERGISPLSYIDSSAFLEEGVTVEAGAVIGAGAQIGSGTVVGAQAIIGPKVCVGRGCTIGPQVMIQHALLGNRVILHPGVRIGQDGFGFAMGSSGHLKVPQIGRVIIQDDVEIGANTTIDRGATRDTVIGEGTKIDNQVQIGHNVVIGRHCILVAQVAVAGSSTLEDFVAIGGQTAVAGHVTVGRAAQVAAVSVVREDLAAGGRYGGIPAKPIRQWFRELSVVARLAEERSLFSSFLDSGSESKQDISYFKNKEGSTQ